MTSDRLVILRLIRELDHSSLVNSVVMNMEQKKMLYVGTTLSSEKLPICIEAGDEEKTITEILQEAIEVLEQNADKSMDARQLREQSITHNYYVNGREISKNALIKDLNFELDMTSTGDALICDLQLHTQHGGG